MSLSDTQWLVQELYELHDVRNNRIQINDRAFHDWYRFVLAFPPHLVAKYLDDFSLGEDAIVLDPFCGTGTTVVESKKKLLRAYGIEANPMAAFAAKVKANWFSSELHQVSQSLNRILNTVNEQEPLNGFDSVFALSSEQEKLLLKNSISPLPLRKCLLLKSLIRKEQNSFIRELFELALAHVSVHTASNLKFGPEVGVSRKQKSDARVYESFQERVLLMLGDLQAVAGMEFPASTVIESDSRASNLIPDAQVDAVITSPPYPNEKDYTRTTRLESVLLDFLSDKAQLRRFKQGLLRSNTRNVYKADSDDDLIEQGGAVDRIAKEIERRRLDLGKTSGFERLYHRVTRLYFGGMRRHLANLKPILKEGARLAYVVGDQASYLQVLIRTGELLGELAEQEGYRVVDIDLFRTRISTATGDQLREEVLVLEWNPKKIMKSQSSRYDQLIEKVFFDNYDEESDVVDFDRAQFESCARDLNIDLPKNLGDIIYSYRYRKELPKTVKATLQPGEEWIIRSPGTGKYQFAKSAIHRITPNPRLSTVKVLDATPEIIRKYTLNDEQALLAILRYNRLIDTFLGITCYPLQSHLRTALPEMGQVETDEIYIGVSKTGAQFVVPLQAKGNLDQLGIVQIEQDFMIGKTKFPNLICRPVAAQFVEENKIALFEFVEEDGEARIKDEKHYQIVSSEDLSAEELQQYRIDYQNI